MKRLKFIPTLIMLGALVGTTLCLATTTNDVAAKTDKKATSDWGKEVSKDAEKNTVDTNLMGTLEDENNDGCGVYTTINMVITILTYGVAIAATVGLVITAIIYITSGDNANRLTMAKTRALEIVVGLGIYAVMWSASQWLIPGGILNDGDICSQSSSASVSEVDADNEVAQEEKEAVSTGKIAEISDETISSEAKVSIGKKGSSAKGASTKTASTTEKMYDLRGKKVLIEGDSIQTKTFGAFLTEMAKSMGASKITNNAVRGATLAYNPDGPVGDNSVYYRISRMSDKELASYDYILISAGTNDWYKYSGVDSGYYWGDKYDDWSYSASTTHGAAAQINDRISTINSDKADEPHTRVVWFSPIYRYLNAGSNPVKKNKKDCDKVKNKYGQTLADYRRAIRQAGGIYISGTAISTKKEASSKDNLKDWLHPTKSYAKTLTKRAIKKFEQLNNGELRIDS